MREDIRDWLVLGVKSILFIVGGILTVAALVDLVVAGLNVRAILVLLVGLALALPPLVLSFRDAVRAARKGQT